MDKSLIQVNRQKIDEPDAKEFMHMIKNAEKYNIIALDPKTMKPVKEIKIKKTSKNTVKTYNMPDMGNVLN